MQQRDKKAHLEQQKYEDRIYSQLEQQRLEHEDDRRQEYFRNIKNFQDKNDEKYKALQNYKAVNIDQLAKQDEQNQIKTIQLLEEKKVRDEAIQAGKETKIKAQATTELLRQIQTNSEKKEIQKQVDKAYA